MNATILSYLYLLGAIAFEVTGTTMLKLSAGFTKLLPSILLFVCYAASLSLFTLALKKLDISAGYAIWAALGTSAIAVIGILFFGDHISPLKIVSLALVIAGVVGLNLSGVSH